MNRPRSKWRLAALATHPIQYQAPLFRHLARNPAIDLTVLFISAHSLGRHLDGGFGVPIAWDVPLLDGYRSEFLPAYGARDELSFAKPLVRGISARLAAGGFDAVWVHGYGHHAALRAISAARRLGIKILLRGETHLKCERGGRFRRTLKRGALPALFSAVDGFLSIGSANREWYAHYGVEPARIFEMPYAVDNDFFRRHAAAADCSRDHLRAELGLAPGRPVILFASKLQARKRAVDLLDAYVQLSPDGRTEPNAALVFVGDGAERRALESRARELGWSSIVFAGFRNQSELPRFYDLCDVFVLPSEAEPWGLVLNEAMNSAKPVIASDQVGAAIDLIAHGENGFVFPARDVSALAACLGEVLSNPQRRATMGARSLERIAQFSFEADERGLLEALSAVCDGKRIAA